MASNVPGNMKYLEVNISPHHDDLLRRIAYHESTNKTNIVRQALDEFFQNHYPTHAPQPDPLGCVAPVKPPVQAMYVTLKAGDQS